MIIDSSIIENGITTVVLDKLIQQHIQTVERYATLKNYYNGKHDILNREKLNKDAANNRIVCNHAKYIVDMIQAYLIGNPVTYSSSDNYDIEALKNAYLEQDISNIDVTIEKTMSICGRAYELVYADADAQPRSVMLAPESTFVVYDNTAMQQPLFAVYYYKRYNLDGNIEGIVCNVYTAQDITYYTNKTDSWLTMTQEGVEQHYFGAVPIIEYQNNAEYQGDFEQLIPLIDSYNTLQSDRVNDKEQFVDAFLFMKNIEVNSEEAQKLKEEKILMSTDSDADVKYLSKVMTESDIKVLRDDLKEDIHRFSQVPDLSDESFGNNLSGVAIKYKLLGFEQTTKNKERYLANGLKKRFAIYNSFLNTKAAMEIVPIHRIDVVFTRNLPVNELEISQMISNLSGIVSNETLLEQLDFVSDAREEQALIEQEKDKSLNSKMAVTDYYQNGGGY